MRKLIESTSGSLDGDTSDSSFDGLAVTHLRLLDTTSVPFGIVVNIYAPRS